jgi:hypothetical protein
VPLLLDEREDADKDQNRVMIAGMDVCIKCHNAQDGLKSIARSDCVECHRYHVDPIDDAQYGSVTRKYYDALFEE